MGLGGGGSTSSSREASHGVCGTSLTPGLCWQALGWPLQSWLSAGSAGWAHSTKLGSLEQFAQDQLHTLPRLPPGAAPRSATAAPVGAGVVSSLSNEAPQLMRLISAAL